MRKLLRTLSAVMVAAAYLGHPLALDACSAACETARSAEVAPPCHHTTGASSRIEQPSRLCGTDHAVVPATPTAADPPQASLFLAVSQGSPFGGAALARSDTVGLSPGPPIVLFSLNANTPLRL